MKTSYQTKTGKQDGLLKAALEKHNQLADQIHLVEQLIKSLGGVQRVAEQEHKSKKAPRRTPHRGAPGEIYDALKGVNGEFTVDNAVVAVKEAKLSLDRTQVLNGLQSLIKQRRVNVVKAGLGRSHAIYELTQPKNKKELKGSTGKETTT